MKTAFVTGGTGFLGLNLVEQLTARGWRVVALHRPTSATGRLEEFSTDLVEGDITDPESLKNAIPRGTDAVFHIAANTSIWSKHKDRQERENVRGTINMLAAARSAGAKRFVHTSTWNTYGLEHREITEATPQNGGTHWINYNRTKFLAEEAVRLAAADGLDAVILNPSHIIGRYDTNNWARMILMVSKHRLPGIPPGSGSFCHGEAVALAHIAAAEQGKTGENYLLGGADASFVEVIHEIGDLTGEEVPDKPVSAWALRFAARIIVTASALTGREPNVTPEGVAMVLEHPRIVSDKAERELGYKPASLRAMLEDAHGWLKAEGLLN